MDVNSSGPDKRQHKRIEKPYTVRFRPLSSVGAQTWDMILIKNISAGGLLFHYEHEIKKDTLLNFKISFAYGMPVIECVGRVLRSNAVGKPPVFATAVNFIEISRSQAELIDEHAEKFYSQNS